MPGYTPAFASMYDGTLCGQWPAAAVWASLLPLLDVHGELNMTFEAISARTGWPMDLLKQGVLALMQPDSDSQSPAEDGRRLVPLDPARSWGWRAVNHDKYREKARKQNGDRTRVASGENVGRMRRRREAELGDQRPAPTRADPLSDSDSDTDTNKKKNIYTSPEVSAGTKESEAPAGTPKRKRSRTERAASPLEPEELGEFRLAYPTRAGTQPWRRAISAIRTRLQEGDSWADIIDGARRYRLFCEATFKVSTEYVMQVSTFVGPERHYRQAWTLPTVAPASETPAQAALRRLTARRAAIGLSDFREPLPNESSKAYAIAQDEEWHRRMLAQSRNRSPSPLEASVTAAKEMAAQLRPMPADPAPSRTRRGR